MFPGQDLMQAMGHCHRQGCTAGVAIVCKRAGDFFNGQREFFPYGLVDHSVCLVKNKIVDLIFFQASIFQGVDYRRWYALCRKAQDSRTIQNEIGRQLELSIVGALGYAVIGCKRLAMPAYRLHDRLIAAAVAVEIEVHRAGIRVKLQGRSRTSIGEERVVDIGRLVPDQQKSFFYATRGDHASQQMQAEWIARAAEVHIERDRRLRQAQPILKDDGGGGNQVVRRLCNDNQGIDLIAIPLQLVKQLLRRRGCQVREALPLWAYTTCLNSDVADQSFALGALRGRAIEKIVEHIPGHATGDSRKTDIM
ncbi:hypothetical protein A9976_21530 [Delftia sp. UME58]|nr:hypothetical protein [Delftia sp. UME58]